MAAGLAKGNGDVPACGRIGNRPYWVLLLSVVIRAVHQVGAAVFLTSFLFDWAHGPPVIYLAVATASGVVLLCTEALRHRQFYRELAGVSTLVKLVLIGLAYHHYLPGIGTVLAAFTLASVAAHLPREIRHRLLF